MDDIDRQILALLVEDGRRSYDDIGRHVSLSAPAVKRRVDALRARGAIEGFTAVVDHRALGQATEALIELFYAPGTLLDEVAERFASHPEVVEAWSVTGDADAIVRVRTHRQQGPRAPDHGAAARRERGPHPLAGRALAPRDAARVAGGDVARARATSAPGRGATCGRPAGRGGLAACALHQELDQRLEVLWCDPGGVVVGHHVAREAGGDLLAGSTIDSIT